METSGPLLCQLTLAPAPSLLLGLDFWAERNSWHQGLAIKREKQQKWGGRTFPGMK